jgi:hypothetical protein
MDRDESTKRVLLGVYLFAAAILLLWLLVKFWPTPLGGSAESWDTLETFPFSTTDFQIDKETRFLLLVLVAAALGSYVHAATSFVTYVGNRSFVASWTWWYILRPLIGIALALVFYFAVRGGILVFGSGIDVGIASLYAMMGLAGLVGLCSKQASDKLRELFDSLFRTPEGEGDAARRDKLGEQIPVAEVMIPAERIVKVELSDERPESEVTMAEMHGRMKGIVTRIPVCDKQGAVKYVIHESVLFKFIADKSMESSGQAPPDWATVKLPDLLASNDVRARVADSMAFVRADALLAKAREAMAHKKGCRDVFVTENGGRDEPVLGWLTNTRIERYCRL